MRKDLYHNFHNPLNGHSVSVIYKDISTFALKTIAIVYDIRADMALRIINEFIHTHSLAHFRFIKFSVTLPQIITKM